MKFKKLTALVLTAMMAVSSLAACGNTKEQENADSGKVQEESSETKEQSGGQTEDAASNEIVFPLEENMTFSMFAMMNGETSYNDVWAWQELERRTNVSFDLTEVTAAEASEKINLLLSSGDYPEVFFKAGGLDCDKYGQDEGVLLPLEDLIREYAPDLTAILDEKDLWNEVAATDGHVYVMPSITYTELKDSWMLSYNEVWLDNLGLEAPTNIDEFYDVLKAIKEQDANGNGDPDDEIPLVCCSDAFYIRCLFPYLATEGVIYMPFYLCMNGNEMSFYPTSEEFKEILAVLAQWYEEGLIDKAAFTQTYEEYFAIGKSSEQYGFIWGDPEGAVGERYNQYAYLDPVEGSKGLAVNSGVVKSGLSITDKCENPEVVVAWCNQFYQMDTLIMANNGQEGVDWEYDENGYIVSLNTGNSNIAGTTHMAGKFDSELNDYFPGIISSVTGEELERADLFTERTGVAWPTTKWADEDSKTRYVDLRGNIVPYVNNYVATVVVGEKSLEDTWEEFQAELEKMGVQEFMELYASALGEDYVVAE
ncbi:MAG: extracellular solute-binding protein [Roseburia sp.]|nr:extracellular solute-binding protein [Roseburia sp.]